jgi:hypothetical protein
MQQLSHGSWILGVQQQYGNARLACRLACVQLHVCVLTQRKCVQEVVETAMLAAVTGLIFLVTATIGLDRYFASVLPLPILFSAMRRQASAGWWTMWASACLITGTRHSL